MMLALGFAASSAAGCATESDVAQLRAVGVGPLGSSSEGRRTFELLRDAGAPSFVIRNPRSSRGVRFYTAPVITAGVHPVQAGRLRGRVGVLEPNAPQVDGGDGYAFMPVILDDGNRYFVRADPSDFFAGAGEFYVPVGGSAATMSSGAGRTLLAIDAGADDASESNPVATTLNSEPLFPDAAIVSLPEIREPWGRMTPLSNGVAIPSDDVAAYRAVAADLRTPSPVMLDRLTRQQVAQDFVSGRITIRSPEHREERGQWEPGLELYILKEGERYQLRAAWQLHARYWHFADRFTVAADGFRYSAPPSRAWRRDLYDAGVWEVFDQPATGAVLEAARQLANADYAVVRFIGRSQSADREVTALQKADIQFMLDLYAMLNRAAD